MNFDENKIISSILLGKNHPSNAAIVASAAIDQLFNSLPLCVKKKRSVLQKIRKKNKKDPLSLLKQYKFDLIFSKDALITVLNNEISVKSYYIVFFHLISFFFYEDENDEIKEMLSSDILNLMLDCILKLSSVHLSEFFDKNVQFFFYLIATSNPEFDFESMLLFLNFFEVDNNLPSDPFFQLFFETLFQPQFLMNNNGFPNNFSSENLNTNDMKKILNSRILDILLIMYSERRKMVMEGPIKTVILYITPYINNFDEKAIKLLFTISNSFSSPPDIIKSAFSDIALSILNRIILTPSNVSSHKYKRIKQKEILKSLYRDDKIINQNTEKENEIMFLLEPKKEFINFQMIETQTNFEYGFYVQEIEADDIYWLLNKIDKNIINYLNIMKTVMQEANNTLSEIFLDKIEAILRTIDDTAFFECMSIFYFFLLAISNRDLVVKYSPMAFHHKIFDENESVFTGLSDYKNAMRKVVFDIFKNQPSIIASFIVNSKNPLFISELFLRIDNYSPYCVSEILKTTINVCSSLQATDAKWHCEPISNARNASFLFLSYIFIHLYTSYDYFSDVMQFCLEKNLTNVFLNIYRESTLFGKDFESLDNVFNFILKLFYVSYDLTWRFIVITHSIFQKKAYLTKPIKKFFEVLINLLKRIIDKNYQKIEYDLLLMIFDYINNPSFLFNKYSLLSDCTRFNFSIEASSIKVICESSKKFLSDEFYYKYFLINLGRPPKQNQKLPGFLIKNPLFLSIMLFTTGFTYKILQFFLVMVNFSIRNAVFFHEQGIDIILIKIIKFLEEKANSNNDNNFAIRELTIYYNGENFHLPIDKSVQNSDIFPLLFLICSIKTDYSVVKLLLKEYRLFFPFLNNLLTYNLQMRPYIKLPNLLPFEYEYKYTSTHFSDNFSLSFYLRVDCVYLNSLQNNLIFELITFSNDSEKLAIYLQNTKIKMFFQKDTFRSDVNLATLELISPSWKFIAIRFLNLKNQIKTYINNEDLNKSDFIKINFSKSPIIMKVGGNTSILNSKSQFGSSIQQINCVNNKIAYPFFGYIKNIEFYPYNVKKKEFVQIYNQSFETKNDRFDILNNNNKPFCKNDIFIDDDIFNVLVRVQIKNQLSRILLTRNLDEKNSYYLLSLFAKISPTNIIDNAIASLKIFVSDKAHFGYRNLFNCYYNIFSSISDFNLKQYFFIKFIFNLTIWKHYSNFRQILFQMQTDIIYNDFKIIKLQNNLLITLLDEMYNLKHEFWDSCITLLKKICLLHEDFFIDGFNFILRKLNSIIQQIPAISKSPPLNKLYFNNENVCFSINKSISNFNEIFPFFQNDINSTKISFAKIKNPKKLYISGKEENVIVQLSSIKTEPTKMLTGLSYKISDINVPKEYCTHYTPQNCDTLNIEIKQKEISHNEKTNIDKATKFILLKTTEFIEFGNPTVFIRNNALPVLLELLSIKDMKTIKSALSLLSKFTQSTNLSMLTMVIFRYIPQTFYLKVFDYIYSQIHITAQKETKKKEQFMINFIPLLCAISYMINSEAYYEKISSFGKFKLSNMYMDTDFWFFFPILICFKINNVSTIKSILEFVFRNTNDSSLMIEKIFILIEFLSNFLPIPINPIDKSSIDILSVFFQICYFNTPKNSPKSDKIFLLLSMSILNQMIVNCSNCNELFHLINTINLNDMYYRVGIQFNHDGNLRFIERVLACMNIITNDDNFDYGSTNSISFSSENANDSELKFNYNIQNVYLVLYSVFSHQNRSQIYFQLLNSTSEYLYKKYTKICLNNMKELIYNLQSSIQEQAIDFKENDNYLINQNIEIKKNNDPLLIINNESNFLRLSTQIDYLNRKMIYRQYKKDPKENKRIQTNCTLIKRDLNNNISNTTNLKVELINDNLKIISPTSTFIVEKKDIKNKFFQWKENKTKLIEIFTDYKSFRLYFMNNGLRKKFFNPKKKKNNKFTNYSKLWLNGFISNFEFLMIANIFGNQEIGIFPSPFKLLNSMTNYEEMLQDTNLLNENEWYVDQNNMDIPSNYYYDFEINSNKCMQSNLKPIIGFNLMYKLRVKLEKCKNIEFFIDKKFKLKTLSKKLFYRTIIDETIQPIFPKKIIFASNIEPYYNFNNLINIKPDKENLFKFIIIDSSFFAEFITNESDNWNNQNRSKKFVDYSKFSLQIPEKSIIYQCDDGIATYDPIKNNLSFISHNFKRTIQSKFAPILLCGKIEKSLYYSISNTVILKNGQYFSQMSSSILILKSSFNFSVLIVVTEDQNIHTLSLRDGKKVAKINMLSFLKSISRMKDIDNLPKIRDVLITSQFGFLLIIMSDDKILLFTINGTFIKSSEIENIRKAKQFFVFSAFNGLDYVGYVTSNDDIIYFESFYPETSVCIGRYPGILCAKYDRLTSSFILIRNNGNIDIISHHVTSTPLSYMDTFC